MKDLEQKLKQLKNVSPQNSWKEENRRVLYNQIKNSYTDTEDKLSLVTRMRQAFITFKDSLSKPAWTVIILSLLIITGGVGVQASQTSKPGDPLYFAKKVTEKVKLAFTFDQKEKSEMNVRFSNDHARDISQTLSDPQFSDQEVVARLESDFKEEVEAMKEELKSMEDKDQKKKEDKENQQQEESRKGRQDNKETNNDPSNKSHIAVDTVSEQEEKEGVASVDQKETEDKENKKEDVVTQEEGGQESEKGNPSAGLMEENATDSPVFIVGSGKEEKGQEIHMPEQSSNEDDVSTLGMQQDIDNANQELKDNKETVDGDTFDELYSLLKEADAAFSEQQYKKTQELLQEFKQKFENRDIKKKEVNNTKEEGQQGEVKGTSTSSTTSEKEASSSPEK